ncbi:hypothetical protein HMI54_012912 [Coelomomyces lativittatus]|nr:hypothetical protein HMI54_012912 [Coelomomyces lativittatus]
MKIKFLKKTLCLFCLLPILFIGSSVRYALGQAMQKESFAFQTDVQKVMKIIINSLYKEKEIFLRELISNASDALEKMRMLGLKDSLSYGQDTELNITVRYNRDKQTLIIADSGIGMTKEDLIKNLGTIAKSGTSEYLSILESQNDTSKNLIGQFGVGFYSSFLVADQVTVISRYATSDDVFSWTSTSHDDFLISKVEEPFGRGTEIHLHMKSDNLNFLDESKLKNLILKYSQFTTFDIFLNVEKTIEVDAEPEATNIDNEKATEKDTKTETEQDTKTDTEKETKTDIEKDETSEEDKEQDTEKVDDDDVKIETETEEKEKPEEKPEEKPKKIKKTIFEWEKVNVQKPIWLRDVKDVQKEEYSAFYKAYFNDYQDPLSHVMFKGEGDINFRLLFFIPQSPQKDVFQTTPEHYAHNIKLFVRRVFITDELLNFLPRFLNFIKGLVDSDDFPLNVSRETVQSHPVYDRIKKVLVSKAIAKMEDLAKNETEYLEFYKNYGNHVKIGCLEETKHSAALTKLLRFPSTFSETNLTSLEAYVSRMKKGQKAIFYITASSVKQAEKSTYLESLKKRGFEALYLVEGIDEYLTNTLTSFGEFPLQNLAKGDFEFGDEDEDTKSKLKETEEEFKPLITHLEGFFSKHVEKVRISNRLTTSPCALVASSHGWTGRMHHIMMAQKDISNPMYHHYVNQKKILEINPKHPIISKFLELVKTDKITPDTESLLKLLFDMAWIKGEYPIKNSASITKRIENAVRIGLEVDLKSEAEVDLQPAQEKETVVQTENSDKTEKKEDESDTNAGTETSEKPANENNEIHDEL